jgi:hypothetical protein
MSYGQWERHWFQDFDGSDSYEDVFVEGAIMKVSVAFDFSKDQIAALANQVGKSADEFKRENIQRWMEALVRATLDEIVSEKQP